jgi:hypothetical protein
MCVVSRIERYGNESVRMVKTVMEIPVSYFDHVKKFHNFKSSQEVIQIVISFLTVFVLMVIY